MNKRYINAADFWNNRPENLDPKKSEYNRGWSNYAEEIHAALEATPTADVEEVRHGNWIHSVKVLDEKHSYHRFKCSLCGRVTARPFETDIEDLPYCHCGAKMDGERREENEG